MEQRPEISVIVPVYKAERYLTRCIDSILSQSHKNLELILVDDGSPDSCPALCDQAAQRDDRVRVIHKENGGVSSARNAGLDIARGEYIGFIDADDWIERDMYEFLLDKALETEADIVQCGYCSDSPERNSYWPEDRGAENGGRDWALTQLLCGDFSFSVLWTKLYKRKLFREVRLDESMHCCEDMLAVFELLCQSRGIAFFNVCKYHYFRDGTSALAGRLQEWHINDNLYFLEQIRPVYQETPDLLTVWRRRKVESLHFLLGSIVRNDLFWERYPELRREILQEKRHIFFKSGFTLKYRAVTLLLMLWPWGFNKVVLVRRRIRGY